MKKGKGDITIRLNLNEQELAEFLGVSQENIALFENEDFNPYRENDHLSLDQKKDMELLHWIDTLLYKFRRYSISPDFIKKYLTMPLETANGSQSIIFMLKNQIPFKGYLSESISSFIEDIIKDHFREENIGSRAPENMILNKLIAEKIFGYPVDVKEVSIYSESGDYEELMVQMRTEVYDDGSGDWWEDLKNYSTDMGHAWEVVSKLASQGVQIRLSNKAMNDEYWWCYMDGNATQGLTAMEAICKGALKLLD